MFGWNTVKQAMERLLGRNKAENNLEMLRDELDSKIDRLESVIDDFSNRGDELDAIFQDLRIDLNRIAIRKKDVAANLDDTLVDEGELESLLVSILNQIETTFTDIDVSEKTNTDVGEVQRQFSKVRQELERVEKDCRELYDFLKDKQEGDFTKSDVELVQDSIRAIREDLTDRLLKQCESLKNSLLNLEDDVRKEIERQGLEEIADRIGLYHDMIEENIEEFLEALNKLGHDYEDLHELKSALREYNHHLDDTRDEELKQRVERIRNVVINIEDIRTEANTLSENLYQNLSLENLPNIETYQRKLSKIKELHEQMEDLMSLDVILDNPDLLPNINYSDIERVIISRALQGFDRKKFTSYEEKEVFKEIKEAFFDIKQGNIKRNQRKKKLSDESFWTHDADAVNEKFNKTRRGAYRYIFDKNTHKDQGGSWKEELEESFIKVEDYH